MNKSQSAGMYIVLAIVVLLFVSSVFLSGPTTKVSEISYSNFLERLDKGEFREYRQGTWFPWSLYSDGSSQSDTSENHSGGCSYGDEIYRI